MERRKSISFIFYLTAAILIAVAGIFIDLVALQTSNARLLDAHHLHLEDLQNPHHRICGGWTINRN